MTTASKKIRYIVISIITLFIIVGGIFFITSFQDFKEKGSNKSFFEFVTSYKNTLDDKEKECDGGPYFTSPPIDMKYISSLIPLGNLNPSGHTFPTDHIYIQFTEDALDIPVYAPGDVTISNISSSYNIWADPPFTDYHVGFKVCGGINAYYIHLNSLSDEILKDFNENVELDFCNTYETGNRTFENCWASMQVEVNAGDIIGTTARETQGNFDLGIYDETIDSWIFSNQDRFKDGRNNYPYTQCPIDYYDQNTKETLMNLFGGFGGEQRTIEPRCGTIGQDKPGTVQGLWFIDGTSHQATAGEDNHIALVHDNIDPTKGVLSIGVALEDIGIPSSAYQFNPTNSGNYNREFGEITENGVIYCYDGYGGNQSNYETKAILLTLVNQNTLQIGPHTEPFCGEGPWDISQYKIFER